MPLVPRLWHYTSTSRDVAVTGRDQIDQDVVDRLLPVVDAHEGDLAALGLGIDIVTPLDGRGRCLPGAAYFQIGPAGERMTPAPYVMAVACWRGDREAGAWGQFQQIVKIDAEAWPQRPEAILEPPNIPWLAVHLLPAVMTLPPATVSIIGDLERCLAWALIASE